MVHYDPLLTIAHGGNHDLQYIGNSVGAAEYVASYASKAEEPDEKMIGCDLTSCIASLTANMKKEKSTFVTGDD